MYPPFEYDAINQRRDELWRIADQARLARKVAHKEPRHTSLSRGVRGAIGSALIRAGRALGGRETLRSAAREG